MRVSASFLRGPRHCSLGLHWDRRVGECLVMRGTGDTVLAKHGGPGFPGGASGDEAESHALEFQLPLLDQSVVKLAELGQEAVVGADFTILPHGAQSRLDVHLLSHHEVRDDQGWGAAIAFTTVDEHLTCKKHRDVMGRGMPKSTPTLEIPHLPLCTRHSHQPSPIWLEEHRGQRNKGPHL